jgi:diguanylate cyclase (GGDEF)-like protein
MTDDTGAPASGRESNTSTRAPQDTASGAAGDAQSPSNRALVSSTPALRSGASYEYLKKQARRLQRAVRAGEPEALARVRNQHPRLGTEAALAACQSELALSDAQLVIAREHGFISWPKLKTAVLALSRRADEGAQLDALVDRVRVQLERFGRLTGRLTTRQLRLARETGDPEVLIAIAGDCFERAEAEALMARDERLPRLLALSDGLERVMDGMQPEPVGSEQTRQSEHADACLVVLYAAGYAHLYGRRYPLTRAVTRIGRNRDQDVVFNSDNVSRAHCTVERREDGRYLLVDQGATNHTFVNAHPVPIGEHLLSSGDRIAAGDTIVAFLSGDDLERRYRETIDYIADRDGLTELDNRRRWLHRVGREVLYARGEERPLSLLFVDLDNLRVFNEKLGPLAGNGLLRALGHALRTHAGDGAVVGRYDSDQFGVLLPDTDLASALQRAEALREAVAALRIPLPPPSKGVDAASAPKELWFTVSLGASTLYRTTGQDELIADAERALRQAKDSGKNRVCGPTAQPG